MMKSLGSRCFAFRGPFRRVFAAMTVAICLSTSLDTTALAPNGDALQAGPVYTSADGNGSPEFPTLRVVVSLPGDGQAPPQAGELSLIEDGVAGGHATSVMNFDATGYGLAAVVAIDVSGSMNGRPLNIIKGSLYKFVSDARKQDSVGVVTIADEARSDVPFGSDQATMRASLQGIKARGTKTRLFDGLLTALAAFDGSSVPARRELTVISDGHDEGSQAQLEDVVKAARDRGIAIDAIGLTRSAPQYLKTLSSLALETGGSFQQVHSDAELEQAIGDGMKRLKATPVATFQAKHISGDGKRHKLGVRWSGGAGATGQTSFLAPKQGGLPGLRSLRHIPSWGYAVLALLCFALLFAAIATIRRLRKRDRVADVPYELPRQPVPPPPSFDPGLRPGNGFPGSPHADGDFGRLADTAGVKPAISAPKIQPVVKPAEQPASRQKQTRLAGVFASVDGAIARLEILTGALSGRIVEVERGEFWIGAAPGNQLVISGDATVSSRHAYLIFEDPILLVVDNRSTNGTRVNGKMLRGSRQPLHDGDQIQVGQTLLRLRSLG